LEAVGKYVDQYLGDILDAFPKFDDIDEIYRELATAVTDYPHMRKSLGAVDWSKRKSHHLRLQYRAFMRRMSKKQTHFGKTVPGTHDAQQEVTRKYQGRLCSVLKQIDENLVSLEVARKALRRLPELKNAFTVVLFGMPNAGKSTLLGKLTTATPEVQPYAFTTKSLNLGYVHGIQFIDTPGVLSRDHANDIELQAEIAAKHADLICLVLDPSMDDAEQKRLLVRAKSIAQVLVYVSKTDLYPDTPIDGVRSPEELLAAIQPIAAEHVSVKGKPILS
ncbi:hypothetical protein COY28_00810, partial [Candidatus Woesearchaeota archaeon CG_4_10_14_0_2_um_filter_57_5]